MVSSAAQERPPDEGSEPDAASPGPESAASDDESDPPEGPGSYDAAFRTLEELRLRASALSRRLQFFQGELRQSARELTELAASEAEEAGRPSGEERAGLPDTLARSLDRYEAELRALEAERDRLRAYLDRLRDLTS